MNRAKKERKFMEIAVEEMKLAKSEHTRKVDPMVGAVLVNKRGKILSRAHRGNFSAGNHAEFTILEKLRSDKEPVGDTLYVTLEPCTKRDPPKKPCAQRAIEKGIARVVIGILDPNPDMYNQGVEYLRRNGIKVDFFDEDLAEEIRVWNKDFIAFMRNTERGKETSTEQHERLGGPSREEERSVPEASVEDFSYEAIKNFLKYQHLSYAVPSQKLWAYFRKAKYLVRREDQDVPTLAGVVLFAEKPEIFLPEHTITVECFSGTPEDGISLDKIVGDGRENITGPLFDTVEACMNFYKKHAAKVPRIKGFQRTDGYEYPEEVIREVIVNALVHRDYTVGAHISFRMFRDRIIIKSPGHLLSPNTIKRVRRFDVTSVRRNQRIAAAAHGMELMEREGYGIPKMRSQLEKYGLRPPNFDYDGGYFVVTFYGREKSPPMYGAEELNERQRVVLEHLKTHKFIKSAEYAKMFKITDRQARADMSKLVKNGLLIKEGEARMVVYRLNPEVSGSIRKYPEVSGSMRSQEEEKEGK